MPANVLQNPSFEGWTAFPSGAGLADSWSDFHNTQAAVTYSRVTSGVTDGTYAQNTAYTVGSGDGNAIALIRQNGLGNAGLAASPGDTWTFSFWASGSCSGCAPTITIQTLTIGGGSQNGILQVPLTGLSSTPQLYTATYVNLPAGTAMLQVSLWMTVTSSVAASWNITVDQADVYFGAPVSAVTVNAGLAAATAQAPAMVPAVTRTAGLAAVTAQAPATVPAAAATAGPAAGFALAPAPSVTTAAQATALAGLAAGTGTAPQPSVSVVPAVTALAGVARGTGTAPAPSLVIVSNITAYAGAALAAGTAPQPVFAPPAPVKGRVVSGVTSPYASTSGVAKAYNTTTGVAKAYTTTTVMATRPSGRRSP